MVSDSSMSGGFFFEKNNVIFSKSTAQNWVPGYLGAWVVARLLGSRSQLKKF